jgi:hypothetical protein
MRGLASVRAYMARPSWVAAVALATALIVPATAFAQAADVTPPDTTITGKPADPTSDRQASFSFTGSDDTTPVDELEFECRLDSQDEAAWLECLSPQFFSLVSGPHTFEVRALDAEENIDPTPARHTWTILPPQTCQEASGTAAAEADTWIDEHSPVDNQGADSTLKVQSKAPSENLRALVRFALPSAPSGCVVESATLRLYAASGAPDRALQALRLVSAWGENNVTWGNQPQTTGTPALTTGGLGYLEWNVTSQAQAMYAGSNYGFLIRDAAEGDVGGAEQQLHSREKLESPPELVLRFGGIGPGGGGPGGGDGQPGPAGPIADEVLAALKRDLRTAARTLRKLGIAALLRRRGARIKNVNALVPGTVRMDAVIRVPGKAGAAKRVVLLRGSRSAARAGKGTLRLKLTKSGRRLLKGTRRAGLTLRASFTDVSGYRIGAPSRKVTLSRKGRP